MLFRFPQLRQLVQAGHRMWPGSVFLRITPTVVSLLDYEAVSATPSCIGWRRGHDSLSLTDQPITFGLPTKIVTFHLFKSTPHA